MALRLYRATANVGHFKSGEIVEVDPEQWSDYIDAGWLKPHDPPSAPTLPVPPPGDEPVE